MSNPLFRLIFGHRGKFALISEKFGVGPDIVRVHFLGLQLLFVITTCLRAQPIPDGIERDDRIGVCTHFGQNWPVEELMPLIAKSGVGWIRDELSWAGLEPAPGSYQIPLKTRAWIHAVRQAGIQIDLILAYGNPAYHDRYDTAAYAKAAGWLARELADEVQAIEILNEPQNFGFRTIYGGAWNGNEPNGSVSAYLQKYVQLLNAAAKEIKLVNPQMTVIGLGTPPPASFRMIALGLAPQVDGLTDHPYGAQMPEIIPYAATQAMLRRDGIATADAEGTFASQVSMFRAQARKWGATEKLWHTEWGYSTVRARSDKHQPGLSEETQAVYILRRILESAAIGIEHTFIYDFKDDGVNAYSDYDNFGLIKNDCSPKQSYFAVQRVTGVLAGMRVVAPEKQASIGSDPSIEKDGLGRRCYTFSSSDEQRTLVAFWEAKSWETSAMPSNAEVTLPLACQPSHVFLYGLLSRTQIEVPWKRSPDGRVSIIVSIFGVPQLLLVS
jgi:hypothetical protein